jgi:hypothetical protein
MVILQIEHAVPNFDAWKGAFDADPIGRERGGVRGYRMLRPVDDRCFAMVELEFDSIAEAEAFLERLRGLWASVQGSVMENPQARIVELVESRRY